MSAAIGDSWNADDAAPVGLIVIIIGSSEWILYSGESPATGTVVTIAAAAGVVAAAAVFRSRPEFDGWSVGTGLTAFAAYALPTLAAGTPTWAGWIKLDDGASFLAMTDQILGQGKVAIPSPASTYDLIAGSVATYPTGSLPPLGITAHIAGIDTAWFVQPYMAVVAGFIGLVLYRALESVIGSKPLRAMAAVIAAQASLLFAYSLWGGIKEVLIAFVLLVASFGIAKIVEGRRQRHIGAMMAMAGATALALIGGSSTTGYTLGLLGCAVIVVLWQFRRRGRILAAALTGLSAIAVVGVALSGWQGPLARTVSRINDIGNLLGPLPLRQMFGIWLSRDFRFPTSHPVVVDVFVALVIVLATLGLVAAVRRNSWTLPVFLAATTAAAVVSNEFVGAWLAGKALAVASPGWIAMAMFGAGTIATCAGTTRLRKAALSVGIVTGVFVSGPVLWSNALAFNGVWLAPHAQMAELEAIGTTFAGEGPSLAVDYDVYGSRHFLRRLSPESISEWRTRPIPLRDGSMVGKGGSADIDNVDLAAVQEFPTLVLRRGPFASRPPYPYLPVWQGTHYEVWRQYPSRGRVVSGLSLGSDAQSTGPAECSAIKALAKGAPPESFLAAATRAPSVAVPIAPAAPPRWIIGAAAGSVLLDGPGTTTTTFSVPRDGRYDVWAAGSFAGRLRVFVDGKQTFDGDSVIVLDMRLFTPLGSTVLSAGPHVATVQVETPWWHPGSGAGPFLFGPLAISGDTAATADVERVPITEARSLCGRDLDWVQVVVPES